MKQGTTAAGQAIERAACSFLQRKGLHLIETNWRCPCGELDLVMLDGNTVVFIEVRSRRHQRWGGALESIDSRKRHRLILAAQSYLQRFPKWSRYPCRFDVIVADTGNRYPTLEWIADAFQT